MVGTIGDVAAFSLNGSKTLGCGEGGLFVTDEENLWQEAARVQQFGEARRRDGKREYNAYGMGWMYRITELQAAFARCQLKRLDEYVDSIRENCDYLRSLISGLDGFNSPIEPMDRKHAYWRYIIRVTPEELGINTPVEDFTRRVRAALIAEGVKCARLEFVIPEMTLFQEKRGYGKGCPWTCNHYRGDVDYKAENYPVAMDTTSRLISLEGIKPPNGKPLMDKYAEAIHKVYENLEQLLDSDVEIEADNVNDLNVY
jgi:perosamine synthetase